MSSRKAMMLKIDEISSFDPQHYSLQPFIREWTAKQLRRFQRGDALVDMLPAMRHVDMQNNAWREQSLALIAEAFTLGVCLRSSDIEARLETLTKLAKRADKRRKKIKRKMRSSLVKTATKQHRRDQKAHKRATQETPDPTQGEYVPTLGWSDPDESEEDLK